jgi:probable rRNA maturation factor
LIVSVERASAQAADGSGGQTGNIRWTPAEEMLLLAVHGTLHVCGWDHAEPVEEAGMRALERKILESLPNEATPGPDR